MEKFVFWDVPPGYTVPHPRSSITSFSSSKHGSSMDRNHFCVYLSGLAITILNLTFIRTVILDIVL